MSDRVLNVGLLVAIALVVIMLVVWFTSVEAESIPPQIITCSVRQVPSCVSSPGVMPGTWSAKRTDVRVAILTGTEWYWLNRCCSPMAPQPSPPRDLRLVLAMLP